MTDERVIERRAKVMHRSGIAVPDAAWDDVVSFHEYETDSALDPRGLQIRSWRSGLARVTAEFMRDADGDPLAIVGAILDEQSRP